ncbi:MULTISPECIES: hypothetical protein [Nitrosomonas]|uniref:Uncharacterized protein n=1 Tax=Nitrosomonas eutropha TaxID=916 RepID=A0ABX5M707_9PROT|nr:MULTISPECIES: hypothetical protein [Nitrosomonas]PXV81141.1 hypothetical protein C8R14_11217 [Nitrosomonas eutropha]
MTCIPVNPELLTWVHECAGLDALASVRRFSKLLSGELRVLDAARIIEEQGVL